MSHVPIVVQEELMNVCPLEAISSENAKKSAAAILKVTLRVLLLSPA